MWETGNPTFTLGVFSTKKNICKYNMQKLYKSLDLALSRKTHCTCFICSNHKALAEYCIDRGYLYREIKLDPIEINPDAYISGIYTTLNTINGLLIINDNAPTYTKIYGLAKKHNIPCKYLQIK